MIPQFESSLVFFTITFLYLIIISLISLFLGKRILAVKLPQDSVVQTLSFIPILAIGAIVAYCIFVFGDINYRKSFNGYFGDWSIIIKYAGFSVGFLLLINVPGLLLKKKSIVFATYYGYLVDFFIIAFVSILIISIGYIFAGMIISPSEIREEVSLRIIIICTLLIVLVANKLITINKSVFLEPEAKKNIRKALKLPYDRESSKLAIELLQKNNIHLNDVVVMESLAWRYYYIKDYKNALYYSDHANMKRLDRVDAWVIKAMILYREDKLEQGYSSIYEATSNISSFHLVSLFDRYFTTSKLTRKNRNKYPRIKDLETIHDWYKKINDDKENRQSRAYAIIGLFLYYQKKHNEARYWFERYTQVHEADEFTEKNKVLQLMNSIRNMNLESSHP